MNRLRLPLALIVALLVVAIAGCGGGDKKSGKAAQSTSTPTATTPTVVTPTTPTATTPKKSPGGSGGNGGSGSSGGGKGGYSATFKKSFVQSCAGRLSKSQCRCIISKAQAQYRLSDFIRAVGKAQRGATPPKLRQIFFSCASA